MRSTQRRRVACSFRQAEGLRAIGPGVPTRGLPVPRAFTRKGGQRPSGRRGWHSFGVRFALRFNPRVGNRGLIASSLPGCSEPETIFGRCYRKRRRGVVNAAAQTPPSFAQKQRATVSGALRLELLRTGCRLPARRGRGRRADVWAGAPWGVRRADARGGFRRRHRIRHHHRRLRGCRGIQSCP